MEELPISTYQAEVKKKHDDIYAEFLRLTGAGVKSNVAVAEVQKKFNVHAFTTIYRIVRKKKDESISKHQRQTI